MKYSIRSIAACSLSSTTVSGQKLMLCAATLSVGLATFAACPNASAAELEITEIEQGEPAPFTGDLFPPRESIAWSLEIEGCYERAALELEHAKGKHDIALERVFDLAAADRQADQARIKLLTAELDEANAWYRSPAFVATVAAAVGAGLLLASTVLVQATAEVGR